MRVTWHLSVWRKPCGGDVRTAPRSWESPVNSQQKNWVLRPTTSKNYILPAIWMMLEAEVFPSQLLHENAAAWHLDSSPYKALVSIWLKCARLLLTNKLWNNRFVLLFLSSWVCGNFFHSYRKQIQLGNVAATVLFLNLILLVVICSCWGY